MDKYVSEFIDIDAILKLTPKHAKMIFGPGIVEILDFPSLGEIAFGCPINCKVSQCAMTSGGGASEQVPRGLRFH